MKLRLSIGIALCALVVAGPAGGAPAWLPPQDLSAPGQDAFDPHVVFDRDGNAHAVWYRFDGTTYIVQAVSRPRGGPWQAAVDLSVPGQHAQGAQVAADPAGNAVAVWHRFNGANTIVQAAVRPAGGTWQLPAQDLSAPGWNALDPQVAVDGAGNAVALWRRTNGMNIIVQAAFRPFGGAWQLPAVDLSSPGENALGAQLAIDPAGNAAAVWWRWNGMEYIVQGAFRPAGGPWQLPAENLSAAGENATDPQVAFDPAGNALAVWTRSNGSNFIVQAARRPSGGGWQLPAQNLSALGQSAYEPQVALDASGNAIAVWRLLDGPIRIVQAAVRPAAGPWQPAQDLSAPDGYAYLPQVVLDAAGNAFAVWGRSNFPSYSAQAAVRPAGGDWQPPRDVSGLSVFSAEVAADGAGNGLAFWYQVGANRIVQAAAFDATSPELRDLRAPTRGFARQRLSFAVDPFDTWSLTGLPLWSFGDGKSASGRMVTHTYAKRGTYTVTVTQADAVANETAATRQLLLRTARCFGSAATKVGSSGRDRIRGTRRADVIVALGGADRVRGRGGNDRICGGKGRDRLAGGAGNDRLNGGPGKDICSQGRGRGRLVSC